MVSSIVSKLSKLTPVVETVKVGNRVVGAVAWTARSAINFTNVFHSVPEAVQTGFNATKLLGGVSIVFSIPTLIHELNGAITARTFKERVLSAFKAVGTSTGMALSGIMFLSGSRDIGLISSRALSWTSVAMQVLFPFMVLGVAVNSYELLEATPDYARLKKRISVTRKSDTQERQIQNITNTCNSVIENKGKFERRLKLGQDLKIDEKAHEVLRALHEKRPDAIDKGEAFSRTLNRRLNTRMALDVVNLATKVTGAVNTGVMIFSGPNPAVLGVGVAVAAISLVTLSAELLLLNKDPFTAPSKWYQKPTHYAREGIFKVHDAVGDISANVFNTIKKGLQGISLEGLVCKS